MAHQASPGSNLDSGETCGWRSSIFLPATGSLALLEECNPEGHGLTRSAGRQLRPGEGSAARRARATDGSRSAAATTPSCLQQPSASRVSAGRMLHGCWRRALGSQRYQIVRRTPCVVFRSPPCVPGAHHPRQASDNHPPPARVRPTCSGEFLCQLAPTLFRPFLALPFFLLVPNLDANHPLSLTLLHHPPIDLTPDSFQSSFNLVPHLLFPSSTSRIILFSSPFLSSCSFPTWMPTMLYP